MNKEQYKQLYKNLIHKEALTHSTMDILNEMLQEVGSATQFNSYDNFKKNFDVDYDNDTININQENIYNLSMPIDALFTEEWNKILIDNEIQSLKNSTKSVLDALTDPDYFNDEADIKGVVDINNFLNRQVYAYKKRENLLKNKQNQKIENKSEKFESKYNHYLNNFLNYLNMYYNDYEEALSLQEEKTLKKVK